MKTLLKQLLTSPVVWKATQPAIGVFSRAHRCGVRLNAEKALLDPQFDQQVKNYFADKRVKFGPFAGLEYPSLQSVCSTIFPKLIGSYERELHEVIEGFASREYQSVIDIGCAEGYYAVGLARFLGPEVRVIACDTDATARELCQSMADLNQVSVQLEGFLDKEKLLNLELGSRSLILADCEGYELNLFDREVAEKLSKHDFLIECHDFLQLDTTEKMTEVFQETHTLKIIRTLDDIMKIYDYRYEDFDEMNLNFSQRKYLLAEDRPAGMQWLYAEAR